MAEEEPVHVDAVDARAGSRSKMTRYILMISMTLVVLIFLFLLFRPFGL